jgi:hypothetical protein
MQPSSPLTGVAAAMALLSSVAGAAVQVYTFDPVHVSDRGTVNFATIDPLNPAVVSSSPVGGIFYFCLNANLSSVYLVDTEGYDMLFMPMDSLRVERLEADYEIGVTTIGTENQLAMLNADDYVFDERFFVGFAFREQGSAFEDPYHYGWAEVSFASDGDLSIYRIGYDTDAGVSITTGAVPEPSSALLTATGLLALAGRRKR